jgi:hypothetical protein
MACPLHLLRCTDLATGLGEEHTQCLQRLLLEAVANGSVTSAHDIDRLLRCTLAGHQHPYHALHAVAKAALLSLRYSRMQWAMHHWEQQKRLPLRV